VRLALFVSLLGGLGAGSRYLLDRLLSGRFGRRLPYGTMAVNVLGSFVAGIVVGATAFEARSPTTNALLLTGFLGGFTTASTLALEIVELLDDRRFARATIATLVTMLLAIAAAALGVGMGRL
jgi:fluoride exporter